MMHFGIAKMCLESSLEYRNLGIAQNLIGLLNSFLSFCIFIQETGSPFGIENCSMHLVGGEVEVVLKGSQIKWISQM